ncbi:MAG: lysophospholipid acyltransferase family protein [Alphaproteobacteria bacterium]
MDKFVIRLIKIILWFRYRISVSGLDEIKQDSRPILFVANHPSLSDPLIVIQLLWHKFHPKALVRDLQINRPIIGACIRSFEPISMPDMRKDAKKKASWARQSIELTKEALGDGHNILIWPAGKLSRDGYDYFIQRSSTHQVFKSRSDCRIVALRSTGIWGSRSSWYNGPDTPIWKIGLMGLIFIPLNLFFFMPKRHIHYEVQELKELEGLERTAFNTRLQNYFNAKPQPAQITPLMWWHKVRFSPAKTPKTAEELLQKEEKQPPQKQKGIS